ncbi:hypothetical protein, partial [Acidovorax sp. SUPP2825]|uniref:hypothetical protein n=1 Tax=Acidovorax sp. SUPP2825 TaxID=2920879 RepID=UPI0024E17A33
MVSHVLFDGGQVRSFLYESVGSTGSYGWRALGHTGSLTALSGNTGWTYVDGADDSIWTFNANGLATSQRLRNGWTISYGYTSGGQLSSIIDPFGRSLAFNYNSFGLIDAVTTPAGTTITYQYDSQSRLTRVVYPDGKFKTYLYEDSNFARLLTGVIDEAQQRYATYAYDPQGRAVSTEHAAGVERYVVSYTGDHSATVTDPLNTSRSYTYGDEGAQFAVLSANKPSLTSAPSIASRQQDSLGFVTSETDFLGSVTTYQWDAGRRVPLSTTQASGTAQARTTSTEWHPQWRLPVKVTEAGRETAYTYDGQGNALTQTVKDTSVNPPVSRTWAWTYHPSGLIASETDPGGAVTTYAYDSAGHLTQATNALGQSSLYTHDAAGRVLTHTAPTGLVSSYQYDARGRLTQAQRGDEVSSYTYTASGQLASASVASGYATSYTYDAAQRLTGWSDNRGASASYTLDGMGNRINESITDAQGQAAWTVARTINSLNRVESVTIGSAATGTVSTSGYGYDANGDLVRSTEIVGGASRSTTLALDALRRVKTLTNAQNASAALEYNAQDAVTKATDFKSVATRYTRDALGNASQEASADSGTLTRTYDSLGLPQSLTDALGRATAITRDALGRPTQIVSSLGGASRTTVLRYDLPGPEYNASGSPSASVGSLSEIQDAGVTTRYQRDAQGRITARTQVLANGSSSTVGYQYVPGGTGSAGSTGSTGSAGSPGSAGAGQIARITYPSGRQLVHQYDATGQLTGLQWNGQPLVSGITWSPLGQATGWQWP